MSEEKEIVTIELTALETGFEGIQSALANLQKTLSETVTSMKASAIAASEQSRAVTEMAASNEKAAASSKSVVNAQKEEAASMRISAEAAKDYNKVWANVAAKRAELLRPGPGGLGAGDLRGFKKTIADIIPTQANNSIRAAIQNVKDYNKAVEGIPMATESGMKNLVSHIATADSIKALGTGFNLALGDMLSGIDKFRLKLSNSGQVIKEWSQHIQNLGKQMQWTGRQMMIGMTLPIVLGAQQAVNAFTSVNTGFTKLARVFAGSITPKMMEQLKKEAEEVSNKYHVMLSDVTQVFSDIAAWGVPADKIKNFADQVLRLTKLGDMNTSQAEDFFRVVNSIFSQQNHIENGKFVAGITDIGKQLAHTGDLMNLFVNVADKTQIMLQDLAQGFPEVAASANLFGFSAADTAAALAGMYQSGIDASEGANGLKFILQRIVNPTDKASKAFKEYAAAVGISIDPTKLKGTGVQKLAQIGAVMQKLGTDAQQRLLGDIGGLRQANRFVILLNQINQGLPEIDQALKSMAGGKNFDDATRGMNDFAKAEVTATIKNKDLRALAEKKLNIVLGSPEEQFKAVEVKFKTFLYKIGKDILPIVTQIGNQLLKVFDFILNLPDPFKKFIIGGLAFLAALGPINFVIGQFGTAVGTVGIFIGKLMPSLKDFEGGADLLRGKVAQVGNQFKILSNPVKRFFSIFKDAANPAATAMSSIELAMRDQTAATEKLTLALQGEATAYQEVAVAATEAATAQTKATQQTMFDVLPAVSKVDKTGQERFFAPPQTGLNSFAKKEAQFFIPSEQITQEIQKNKDEVNKAISDALYAMSNNATKDQQQLFAVSGAKGETLFGALAGDAESLGSAASAATPEVAGLGAGLGEAATGGTGLLSVLAGPLGIGAAIAAVALALIGIVPLLAKLTGHWNDFMSGARAGFDAFKQSLSNAWQTIQPGINAIGQAFSHVLGALSQIGDAVGQAFGQLVKGSNDAGEKTKQGANKAASGWQGAGQAIGGIAKGFGKIIEYAAYAFNIFASVIAGAIDAVAGLIRSFVSFFRDSFKVFADVIGIVVFLLRGDFVNAFKWAMVAAVDLAIKGVDQIIQPFQFLGSVIDQVLGTNIEGAVKSASKWLHSLRNDIVDWINPAKPFSFKFPNIKAPSFKKGDMTDVGQAAGHDIAQGMASALDDSDQIFDGFLSALKSRLDKTLDVMKQAAIDSLAAQHASELKVYDDKIKAIDDLQKKEQELADTEAYLQKRKDILDQYALDSENYRRNRALAIYEGRIDDARGLDLNFQKTTKDSTKSLTELDAERAKALLDATRQAQKDAIQAQKDAAAEIFKTQEDSFKKQLDLITQYTPRTIGEMQSMIDGINGMLVNYGAPTLSSGYADAFGSYKKAVDDAKTDLIHEAFWNGKDVSAAWLLGFGGLTPQNLFGKPKKTDQPLDIGTPLDSSGDAGGDTGTPDLGSFGKQSKPKTKDVLPPNFNPDMKKAGKDAGDSLMDGIKSALIAFVLMGPISLLVGGIVLLIKTGIMDKLVDAGSWLIGVGGDIIGGLLSGISSAAQSIYNWFMSLPGTISNFLAQAGSGFIEMGSNFINWIVTGVANAAVNLFNFFTSLPEKIFNFFMQGASFFARIGAFIFEAIGNGIASTIGQVWGWFARIVPDGFIETVKHIAEAIVNTLIDGVNGLFGLVNKAIDLVGDIPIIGDILDIPHIPKISHVHFHTGGYVKGLGDVPAILQAGEFVMKRDTVDKVGIPTMKAINKFGTVPTMGNVTAVGGNSEGSSEQTGSQDTYISVDTFIGQREWFNDMMKDHKVKTKPKHQRRSGTLNRKLGSYADNNIRYDN